jgi:hypothetical protein
MTDHVPEVLGPKHALHPQKAALQRDGRRVHRIHALPNKQIVQNYAGFKYIYAALYIVYESLDIRLCDTSGRDSGGMGFPPSHPSAKWDPTGLMNH